MKRIQSKPNAAPSWFRPFVCGLVSTALLLSRLASAQVAEPAAPPAAAAPAPAAASPATSAAKPPGTLGNDAPMFNPGTEILTWDGKNWNINNNRLFEAR